MTRVYTLRCADCGDEFEAVHHFAKFCGPTCRSRAHRRRQKDEMDRLRALVASVHAETR